MKIIEVQIVPIKPNDGLVALASVVFDDCLYLGSIGVHTRLDNNGYRITYPTKKSHGRDMNIFHPINRMAGKAIEDAIIKKLEEVMKLPPSGENQRNEYAGYGNT